MKRSFGVVCTSCILVAAIACDETTSVPVRVDAHEPDGSERAEEDRGRPGNELQEPHSRPTSASELTRLELEAMDRGMSMLEEGATHDEVARMLEDMGANVARSSGAAPMISFDFGYNSYALGAPPRTGPAPGQPGGPLFFDEWEKRLEEGARRVRAMNAERAERERAIRAGEIKPSPPGRILIPDY